MNPVELKQRSKAFGLQVIKKIKQCEWSKASDVICKQLLRSATSVGANYRAACRARSCADFISKINIVEEEADESAYWIELLIEANISDGDPLNDLLREANELTAIFTACGRTAKNRLRNSNPQSAIRNPK